MQRNLRFQNRWNMMDSTYRRETCASSLLKPLANASVKQLKLRDGWCGLTSQRANSLAFHILTESTRLFFQICQPCQSPAKSIVFFQNPSIFAMDFWQPVVKYVVQSMLSMYFLWQNSFDKTHLPLFVKIPTHWSCAASRNGFHGGFARRLSGLEVVLWMLKKDGIWWSFSDRFVDIDIFPIDFGRSPAFT